MSPPSSSERRRSAPNRWATTASTVPTTRGATRAWPKATDRMARITLAASLALFAAFAADLLLGGPLLTLTTYSFPSGHAAGSTVFWGFVCVVAWHWPARDPLRRAVAVIAPAMVALTCLSRVYLGAHYFSDVLAGICEGIAWVCV